MAQTKKKRRRKHRGTQGGRVDTNRRTSKPRSRAEAKRGDSPPTWRGAIIRGVVAAVVFTALLMLIFGRSLGSALGIGVFMLVFYIPAGYYMDNVLWRRRERARIRAAEKQ